VGEGSLAKKSFAKGFWWRGKFSTNVWPMEIDEINAFYSKRKPV